MNRRDKITGTLQLLLAAFIWGIAFVAQQTGMNYVGPFTFNAIRNLIGAAVLCPCIWFLKSRGAAGNGGELSPGEKKALWQGGLVCGFFLCVAGNLQQVGLKYTSVGKAGFITAMYIVIVPLLGLFLRRKVGLRIWISVVLAVIGLYLLSVRETLTMGKGDFLTLMCAFAFSFQIMAVDYFSKRTDGVRLAQLQFLVCGLLTLIPMVLTEQVEPAGIRSAGIPILYAGVLSCGVAYTMQILGQRKIRPAIASLLMSLESVISALAGWILLSQVLSGKELAGCVIMFAAILLAQL